MKEVAVGIVRVDGKILACQRRRNAVYALKWEFPGGKIESGESPREALRRELKEELGIEATIGQIFLQQEWVYPDNRETSRKDGSFRIFYHTVDHFEGIPVNVAFEQIRWVTIQELSDLDILEGNREAINLLMQHEHRQPLP